MTASASLLGRTARMVVTRLGVEVVVDCPSEDDSALRASMSPFCAVGPVDVSKAAAWSVDIRRAPPGQKGWRAVESPTRGVALFANAATGGVAVVASSTALRVLGARRLVKAVLRRCAARSGTSVWLHSAAIAVGGGAVALVGGKRAGKTTLALALLATADAGLIGNSEVSFHADKDGWLAVGWPRAVAIRRDTLQLLAAELSGFPMLGTRLTHPNNSAPHDVGAASEPDRIHVMPDELVEATGRLLQPEARLGLVVLPVFEVERPEVSVRVLDPTAAAGALSSAWDGGPDRFHPFLDDALPLPSDAVGAVADIAESVRCVEIRYGCGQLAIVGKRMLDHVRGMP